MHLLGSLLWLITSAAMPYHGISHVLGNAVSSCALLSSQMDTADVAAQVFGLFLGAGSLLHCGRQ
jgi:hypothetical protein